VASSPGATSTRTPSSCSCGSCPPASSADTAALKPLLRSRPAISSASVRLATTATGTVNPSTIHSSAPWVASRIRLAPLSPLDPARRASGAPWPGPWPVTQPRCPAALRTPQTRPHLPGAFPRKRLVKSRTRRFRGNVMDVAAIVALRPLRHPEERQDLGCAVALHVDQDVGARVDHVDVPVRIEHGVGIGVREILGRQLDPGGRPRPVLVTDVGQAPDRVVRRHLDQAAQFGQRRGPPPRSDRTRRRTTCVFSPNSPYSAPYGPGR
jgi:hypothetical protein